MSDILERLRGYNPIDRTSDNIRAAKDIADAATEIERLRAELLATALEFANAKDDLIDCRALLREACRLLADDVQLKDPCWITFEEAARAAGGGE